MLLLCAISCTRCEIRANEISAEQRCAASKKSDVAIALDFVCVHCKRNLIEIRLKHHRVQLTNTDNPRGRMREKIRVGIEIILFPVFPLHRYITNNTAIRNFTMQCNTSKAAVSTAMYLYTRIQRDMRQ